MNNNPQLFPLSRDQRLFLEFVYSTLAKHGRLPRFPEATNYFGWKDGVRIWTKMLKHLRDLGWIHRDEHLRWWPIGVDRTMTFRYPASLFLPTQRKTFIQLDSIQHAPGEPETLQRLDNLAKLSQSFGLHHEDALTIQWAVDTLNNLHAIAMKIASCKGSTGSRWQRDHRIVPIALINDLVETLPLGSVPLIDFAIHSEKTLGAAGVLKEAPFTMSDVGPQGTHSEEPRDGEETSEGRRP